MLPPVQQLLAVRQPNATNDLPSSVVVYLYTPQQAFAFKSTVTMHRADFLHAYIADSRL